MAEQRYIKIPAPKNIITKSFGDKIKFYTSSRHFVTVTGTDENIKNDVEGESTDTYKYSEGQYIKTNQYEENTTYYYEPHTAAEACPACGGDGTLTGNNQKEYTCPHCKGKGEVYYTIQEREIQGITVVVKSKEADGYSIKYSVVPSWSNQVITISPEDIYTK